MRIFHFTLQAPYSYKRTVEKLQMAELKSAQQDLREFRDEEARLVKGWVDNERSLERALKSVYDIGKALIEHDAYFRSLRDGLVEIRKKIVNAEEIVLKCQEKLILTMKELKAYQKLRDEQYQAWLKGIKSEEAKEMDDLVQSSKKYSTIYN